MQGKVSMVMPCYNKAEYIAEMLDSVIAQSWDAIELILVNDGSTDGTRRIIEEYAPRIRSRGFELVIIDQENSGVCAAAKAGLERATGDYVCVVDSDDELDPEYAGLMAGWLDNNPEFDYAACSHVRYTGSKDKKEFTPSDYPPVETGCENMTERYLTSRICEACWAYMVRYEYMRKCRIAENYGTERGSHEPFFMVPLTAYGGNVKSFSEPLYRFNVSMPVTHSRPGSVEKAMAHYKSLFDLSCRAIKSLPGEIAGETRKSRFISAANIRYLKHRLYNNIFLSAEESVREQIRDELTAFLNGSGLLRKPIKKSDIATAEFLAVKKAESVFFGESSPRLNVKGRIIGYGAMGKAAAKLLPLLKATALEPAELWDANGDGITVKKPDFPSLSEDDTVLVFPLGEAEESIRRSFKSVSFRVVYNADIYDFFFNEFFK